MNMNTVYIVDDDRLNVDQFLDRANLFLECGFEIVGHETNPYKALDAIRSLRPDTVLSDLKMPGMNGLELWSKLRDDKTTPVFVIISAYNDFGDVRKFFLTQGFDYLLKPIEEDELVELLISVSRRLNKNTPALDTQTPSEELNEIILFLKEYPAMNHSLESIAKRYNTKPRTVCRLFSKYLNTTFLAFLTHLRMQKAEALLRSEDLMVKKIAPQCGFTDQLYFTRVFKREHGGMSPSDYREAQHGK